MEYKTSAEWKNLPEYNKLTILDYDGWSRNPKDWEYSWNQELITKQEFEKRLCSSTILWRRDHG